MKILIGVAAAAALMFLGGCTVEPPAKPKPPLAARLERDGAGDLTVGEDGGAPAYVISNFFDKKGLAYAAEIRAECEAIRQRGYPPGWQQSIDARICGVANLMKHGAKP